jgi:hypothetical protein
MNLWATAVYSWTEWSTVRWNYYQWGNNYGFANNLSWDWWDQVDASSYWPWNYYNDSTFRAWNSDWSSVRNYNLWWWGSDTISSCWTNWTDRKWPCSDWYHVPSTCEWAWLFKLWCQSRWWSLEQCTISAWTSKSWSILSGYNSALTLANFKSDLKLPLAGYRSRSNGSVNNQGSSGYYWSSSPNGTNVPFLYFLSSSVRPQYSDYRAYGLSVRCFKN